LVPPKETSPASCAARRVNAFKINIRPRIGKTPTSPGARILRVALAVVAIALGVVFVFLPGPGVVFFALAGALLAPESRLLAAALDWTELKIRAGLAWAKRIWKKLGWFARSLAILVAMLLAIPVVLAVWYRFFESP